jgi:hypothetical protein
MSAAAFDLPINAFTDVDDVALDPSEYLDNQPVQPLVTGNYAFRIKGLSFRKAKKDSPELRLVDGKYPVLVLEQVEVVEPTRTVALYQDFGTKPFTRKDFGTGQERPANNVADILRSHDAALRFGSLSEGIQMIQEIAQSGGLFHAFFDWTAQDMDGAKEAVTAIKLAAGAPADAQNKDLPEEVRKKVNEAYGRFRLRGMKKFKNPATGIVVPIWTSPAGNDVEARVEIRNFISTNDLGKVKLGPRA